MTPGFKFALTFSGTCEAFGRCERLATMRATGGVAGGSPAADSIYWNETVFGTSFAVTGSATSTHRGYSYFRIAVRCSVGGTFRFQWAQSTSDAANTTVYGGAYLLARQPTEAPPVAPSEALAGTAAFNFAPTATLTGTAPAGPAALPSLGLLGGFS